MKKTLQQRKDCACFVQNSLIVRYPSPVTHLDAESPWQLLVATVLAAQCTDARVNVVTPQLFSRWPDSASLVHAQPEELEKVIYSTGFYRNKAKNLLAAAQRVQDVYNGEVPQTMEELITLPGVARKTANVVLWGAFNRNMGIAVDTHVGRIARRLGLSKHTDPDKVEKDLMQLFPQEEWGNVNHRLVWFGREVCNARNPVCSSCELQPQCPRLGVKQRK